MSNGFLYPTIGLDPKGETLNALTNAATCNPPRTFHDAFNEIDRPAELHPFNDYLRTELTPPLSGDLNGIGCIIVANAVDVATWAIYRGLKKSGLEAQLVEALNSQDLPGIGISKIRSRTRLVSEHHPELAGICDATIALQKALHPSSYPVKGDQATSLAIGYAVSCLDIEYWDLQPEKLAVDIEKFLRGHNGG